MRASRSIFFIVAVLLISTKDASAYLDMGTGSQLFQLLIASLVGALVTVKIYWLKVKQFFINLTKKAKNQD